MLAANCMRHTIKEYHCHLVCVRVSCHCGIVCHSVSMWQCVQRRDSQKCNKIFQNRTRGRENEWKADAMAWRQRSIGFLCQLCQNDTVVGSPSCPMLNAHAMNVCIWISFAYEIMCPFFFIYKLWIFEWPYLSFSIPIHIANASALWLADNSQFWHSHNIKRAIFVHKMNRKTNEIVPYQNHFEFLLWLLCPWHGESRKITDQTNCEEDTRSIRCFFYFNWPNPILNASTWASA